MRNGKRKLRSSTWRDGLKQWIFAAGIKILIAPRPEKGANFVTYDIQESGALTNVAASVTFYMREGWVRPNTDAYGCTLPAVPLDNVSEAWATSVADEVMFAVLRETSG